MQNNLYLALYKGTGGSLRERLEDKAIRLFTRGEYSHCEIAVEKWDIRTGEQRPEISFDCYSSSPRDGGVRCKKINVTDRLKWDLIPLDGLRESQITAYFQRTKGAKYDHLGAMGIILGTRQNKERYFCSEWCFNAIFGGENGWHFSPNALAAIVKGGG